MAKVKSYQDLEVWKLSMQTVKKVFELTETFPKSQAYVLVQQIQRCAISIPSNIAEGHSRNSRKEFIQFVAISMGSRSELETQILIAKETKNCDPKMADEILDELKVIGKMLYKMNVALKAK